MKHTRLILLVFLLVAAQAVAQEYRGVTLEITVNNGAGREQVLALGLREGATSGLDPALEEAELPPQPPNEIFDARVVSTPGKSQLGTGTLADYRSLGTGTADIKETYTLAYQAGINASGVTLSWGPEIPGRVKVILIDGEDQSGKTSYESGFSTGQITVEITFTPTALSFEASPNPVLFNVNNKDPLPTQTLRITPRGDPQASWSLSTDADWIDIQPSGGEGQQDVEVMVNTRLLPAGTYDGMISVRSLSDPARLDVPVRMIMVVGVEDAPVAGQLYLGQNYPNPFGSAASSGSVSTRIDVDLGSLSAVTAPSLRIYDMAGREVMDLSDRLQLHDGLQSVTFDAASLPGGVYTYTLRHAGAVRTRSMILTK
ncbi:MAG: T9SS type A sorting domain-containing protein [Bacteroidetes bacterium]|nr:T9SS type A sorting domain-containing protein [Bacteroidota bacterium]